jgi:hypothetical protein
VATVTVESYWTTVAAALRHPPSPAFVALQDLPGPIQPHRPNLEVAATVAAVSDAISRHRIQHLCPILHLLLRRQVAATVDSAVHLTGLPMNSSAASLLADSESAMRLGHDLDQADGLVYCNK